MPKSNIYVSICTSKPQPHEGGEQTYRKTQPSWYLSVEPKKIQIPCIPSPKHAEPLHYGATVDDATGLYKVETHSAASSSMIFGNILVAEKVKASKERVLEVLRGKLKAGESSLPSEQTDEGDPDHWVRKALHQLQREKILEAFDVGEFMTFAHTYAANRTNGENAPAMVAYPRLNKDHEKKAKTHSFWVDYPMANKPAPRNHVEGNQKKYGSLM